MKMNAGAWIGIIGGLVGIIVAIASVLAVGDSTGIYIAGGILLFGGGMFYLFYKLLFAPMILASRLQKTGIPGKATIKEVRDTGVTVNNSPQVKLVLDVKNSFGQVYSATIRTLVSRLQPQLYQPGMVIPVLIDPKDENKMVIDFNSNAKTHGGGGGGYNSNINLTFTNEELMKQQAEDDSIRLTGISARAIIKKNTFLGVNINGNNPYTEFELEVLPADAPAFEAKVKAAISELSIAKYQPGREIFVKYDPNDKTKVAIEHS